MRPVLERFRKKRICNSKNYTRSKKQTDRQFDVNYRCPSWSSYGEWDHLFATGICLKYNLQQPNIQNSNFQISHVLVTNERVLRFEVTVCVRLNNHKTHSNPTIILRRQPLEASFDPPVYPSLRKFFALAKVQGKRLVGRGKLRRKKWKRKSSVEKRCHALTGLVSALCILWIPCHELWRKVWSRSNSEEEKSN